MRVLEELESSPGVSDDSRCNWRRADSARMVRRVEWRVETALIDLEKRHGAGLEPHSNRKSRG